MFELVKYVITTKVAERETKALKRDNAARRQTILEILESKKADGLKNMSAEDLQKEYDSLEV